MGATPQKISFPHPSMVRKRSAHEMAIAKENGRAMIERAFTRLHDAMRNISKLSISGSVAQTLGNLVE